MTSSSTSSIQNSFKYDVFLSFRGEDTRTNFVDHLYYALQQKSIHTYKDDQRIKKGKKICDELSRSIEDSKFYIIVFSKDYASSSSDHTAYPLFFDVEPYEVRKQKGAVKKAFAKHVKEESAGKWRETLKEAANLAGWELKNRPEAEFIQQIVQEISLELRSINFSVDEKLVGMETRIKNVVSYFGSDFGDVRMIGITGIGGGGKTTLARAVYDQISFQFEEDDYKEIFLDVACMLKGWSRDSAIKALESCGFHGRSGLRVLEQKSLITIDNNEWVDMHDHIEEMGRNIVRCSHRDKPRHHTRLWVEEEIKDILVNDLGTEATRCMRFYTEKFNPETVMIGLRKMKELRFLDVSLGFMDPSISDCFCCNWKFNKFPNALRYLRWKYYPFRSLPRTFQANNLVSLEMAHSRIIQLWEEGERKVLNKLRFLNLNSSKLKTLDLRLAKNLEWLVIGTCYDLVELHLPDGCLKFRYLDFTKSKLRTLDLRLAPNLEKLILDRCNNLVQLQMPGRCQNLRSLKLTNSKVRTLDIRLTPNLEYLDLSNCYYLEELHMAGECQKLTILDISHSKLRTVDLGLTPNLERLDLKDCCNLEEVHAPIGCLRRLVYLHLSGCLRFKYFLFDIEDNTSSSVDESLEVGPLAELHLIAESLETCRLHPNNNLPKFQLRCFYKEDRPLFTRNLEKLISLGLCACTNLETFSQSICGLRNLRKLKLKGSIPEAPKNLDEIECLEELSLLSTNITHLPDSICMLKHLKSLKLKLCSLLEKLPEDLGQLECLEKLTLSEAKIKHLPRSICMLKRLKILKLKSCLLLEKLPEDLGRLECLEKLSLSFSRIKHLPDSICMLKRLKTLKLKFCLLLVKLPEDLCHLECLEKLSFSSTMIKHLPESFRLKSTWPLEKSPEDLVVDTPLKKLHLSSTMSTDLPKLRFLDLSLLNKYPEEPGGIINLEKLTFTI